MRGDGKVALLLFLLLSCVFLVTLGGHFYSGDGIEVFKTAESLVVHGDLAVRPGPTGRLWGYPGVDGKRYAPYGLGLSLVEAPLYAAARAAVAPLPLGDVARARMAQAAAVSANVFVTAASALLLFLLARAVGFGRRAGAGTALLFGLGTMAWVYSKHDFAEPLAGACLLGAVYFLVRADERPGALPIVLAGLLNGYGFFTKYQMVIYTPLLAAYLLLGGPQGRLPLAARARRLALFLAPGLFFGLANLAVNQIRFGHWLETGYAQQGAIYAGLRHIPVGLFGLLLSPGKGLIWYSPLVLAAPFAWRRFHLRHRRLSWLSAGIALATIAMFAPTWWWHGDWAWGPRYMVLILPFLILPLGAILDDRRLLASRLSGRVSVRAAIIVLLLAAVAVNLLGIAVNYFSYIQMLRDTGKVHDDWNFIPGLSPLRFHAHMVRGWILRAFGGEIPDFRYTTWSDGRFSEEVIRMSDYSRGGKEPDLFFFRRRDTRLEQAALGAAGAALLAGAFLCGRRLRRLLRTGPP